MSKYAGKVMVLGASYSQIPLMEAVKKLGYEALAVSIPGDYAGFAHADRIIYADITDPEAVLREALKEQVDAVVTCCMDVGIRSLGYVCEKMGLPGPGIFSTEAACNKYLEKNAYMKAGVNCSPGFKVSGESELREALSRLHFPVILKAVDLTGSKGIFRADTEEEAVENFYRSLSASRLDYCIVEEFLQGEMFGVEAMISCGKLAYCLPLGNTMRKGNPTFPIGHYVPWLPAAPAKSAGAAGKDSAEGKDFQKQVEEQVLAVAKALGFDNCGMDLDCMYMDGKIYIIEATARAGATCITDTVSIYYGIDYFEALVRAALGQDVREMFRKKDIPDRFSMTRLLSAPEKGRVREIRIPGKLPENVYDLSFNVKEGDSVRPMQNGGDRVGQLIVRGSSLEKCQNSMDEVLGQIDVLVED